MSETTVTIQTGYICLLTERAMFICVIVLTPDESRMAVLNITLNSVFIKLEQNNKKNRYLLLF
jgi:hypothetical protein